MKIGIIGGGPAGIFAAIEASKFHSDVTLFDNNNHLGRKLSVTGAGRCNLTNEKISKSFYSSTTEFKFGNIIDNFGYNFLEGYFQNLGIYTYHTDDGWVYPLSNSAKNIALFLAEVLYKLNVTIKTNIEITNISKQKNKFVLSSNQNGNYSFDKIIVSTGSKAHPQLKSNDILLKPIRDLGHNIIQPYPALAPILTSKNETKDLFGVRQDAAIRIYDGKKLIGSEIGNIIFTEWGVNGPGVMNLSHLVHKHNNLSIEICYLDILPENFKLETINRKEQLLSLRMPFLSIINNKIIDSIFAKLSLDINSKFSEKNFQKILDSLSFREMIIGTRDLEFSQISTGGVDSREVNTQTFESLICPGMYFAGEILDVFGPCGGYNLHWAFVSGLVAGKSASASSLEYLLKLDL